MKLIRQTMALCINIGTCTRGTEQHLFSHNCFFVRVKILVSARR